MHIRGTEIEMNAIFVLVISADVRARLSSLGGTIEVTAFFFFSPECSWSKSEAVLSGSPNKAAEMRERLSVWSSIGGALVNLHNRVPVPHWGRQTAPGLPRGQSQTLDPHLTPDGSYRCSPSCPAPKLTPRAHTYITALASLCWTSSVGRSIDTVSVEAVSWSK